MEVPTILLGVASAETSPYAVKPPSPMHVKPSKSLVASTPPTKSQQSAYEGIERPGQLSAPALPPTANDATS